MLLELQDVSKSYPTGEGVLQVLRGVSLALGAGESLALTGESGSGKSTIARLLLRLDRPDAGELRWRGEPYARLPDLAAFRARRLGFVFQSFNLLPNLTVRKNIELPMDLWGRSPDPAWLIGRSLALLLKADPASRAAFFMGGLCDDVCSTTIQWLAIIALGWMGAAGSCLGCCRWDCH